MGTDVDIPRPGEPSDGDSTDPASVDDRPLPLKRPEGHEHDADPFAPNVLPPLPPLVLSRGWRRVALRAFVASLLVVGLAVGLLAAHIVRDGSNGGNGARGIDGVVMPDDTAFRRIVNDLLDRKQPVRLRGMTVVGANGTVTVLPARAGAASFPSSYLNPNALRVIARSVGLRSNDATIVEELRLEVPARTGRQRWRLRGTRDGQLWRAVINPNGTGLRRITGRQN